MSHLNIAGLAKSMRDNPNDPNVARLMKAADDVVEGKEPATWTLTARDVSDLMSAYAMSKCGSAETVAHAFGRLMIQGESRMVKLYQAHDILLRSGRHGDIYGAAA